MQENYEVSYWFVSDFITLYTSSNNLCFIMFKNSYTEEEQDLVRKLIDLQTAQGDMLKLRYPPDNEEWGKRHAYDRAVGKVVLL